MNTQYAYYFGTKEFCMGCLHNYQSYHKVESYNFVALDEDKDEWQINIYYTDREY